MIELQTESLNDFLTIGDKVIKDNKMYVITKIFHHVSQSLVFKRLMITKHITLREVTSIENMKIDVILN